MSKRQTHAVIVTYQPDAAKLEEIVAALEGTVAAAILVDNSSPAWDPQSLSASQAKLIVKRLAANEGIAAAQNEGIALARAGGASCVLLLDQDSLPQAGMVSALEEALQGLRDRGERVACVGSRQRLPGRGRPSDFETLGWLGPMHGSCDNATSVVPCDTLISSGTLIPLDVIDNVGGMDESLFIDLVDTEWCFRAKAKGYQAFGACGAVLEHRLGESTRLVWVGRWRHVPRHKAFRYYYIFRNTLLLSRRSYVPWRWALYYLRWLVILFIVHGVFAAPRAGELRMMLKGVLDGLRSVTGRWRDG